jgi:hypothetical protein
MCKPPRALRAARPAVARLSRGGRAAQMAGMTDAAPLILTLGLDAAAFARLDAARQAHFPPGRNLIPAHLTLFHALPGTEEGAVARILAAEAAATPPLALRVAGLRFLGRGVAFEVEGAAMVALRARLAAAFAPWLGAQDRQGWRPACHGAEQGRAGRRAGDARRTRRPIRALGGDGRVAAAVGATAAAHGRRQRPSRCTAEPAHQAQGGSPRVVDRASKLPRCPPVGAPSRNSRRSRPP